MTPEEARRIVLFKAWLLSQKSAARKAASNAATEYKESHYDGRHEALCDAEAAFDELFKQ